MRSDRQLEVYLSDHLAGATAGVLLARRCALRERESLFGEPLDALLHEIEDDRRTLESVMAVVAANASPAKNVAAVVGERASLLKNALPFVGSGSADVARLEDLELLSIGVEGKRLLWVLLGHLASSDQRLSSFDFEALESRARNQRERLEKLRLRAADASFSL